MQTIGSPALWIGFTVCILVMLALDLGVFNRNAHAITLKEALLWTLFWIALSLGFNGCVYAWFGTERALEFTTGYLLEKALSVDNIFVFVVIFGSFAVDKAHQHRVLFWGVLGALVLRALFIGLGAALVQRFHWVLYLFGIFLLITAIRLLRQEDQEEHPENNAIFRWFRRVVPSTDGYRGAAFFVRENGVRLVTPLLLVLVLIEITDVLFAFDSIPAIFAVTQDPFIVFTSNICAILGLRSIYFLLAHVMNRFQHLQTGLALVLAFVGLKMLLIDIYAVPIGASLATIAVILLGSVAASLWSRPASARVSGPDGLDVRRMPQDPLDPREPKGARWGA